MLEPARELRPDGAEEFGSSDQVSVCAFNAYPSNHCHPLTVLLPDFACVSLEESPNNMGENLAEAGDEFGEQDVDDQVLLGTTVGFH